VSAASRICPPTDHDEVLVHECLDRLLQEGARLSVSIPGAIELYFDSRPPFFKAHE
jgi:hypothetical protein